MSRKRIAVITARADDSEQRAILSGVAEAAFTVNADIVVFSNIYNHWVDDDILNYENHIYDFFEPEQFDGVVITFEAFRDISMLKNIMKRIRKVKLPAVMIGGEAKGFVSICSNDTADMERLTEHLITVHGLRHFDILTGFPDMPVSQQRVNGCRSAFAKYDIPFDDRHVFYGNFWNDAGEKLAMRYLNGELPMPEAVICTNDYMAFGLCDTLTAAKVRIPEQITVTGYDHNDSRLYHHPFLTTYRRNRKGMGESAVKALFPEALLPSDEENRLICGDTCGCGVDGTQISEEMRLARITRYHAAASSAAHFSSRLTLCRTIAEFAEVIREFYYLLHGAENVYLCLDKQWNSSAFEGKEFLCCAVSETAVSEMPVHFERSILLPIMHEQRGYPLVYYVSPLCFQKRLFGYTVLSYHTPDGYDFSFREWNKTAANTLELMCMKNDIHYLTQCQLVSTLYDALTGFYQLHEFRNIADSLTDCCVMQGIKLNFHANGEYVYGDNFRNDIISDIALAIKSAVGKHEICCRAAKDVFIILCKENEYERFSDKMKVMIHHVFCEKYSPEQVTVTYLGIESSDIDTLYSGLEKTSNSEIDLLRLRHELPHYKEMEELRTSIQKAPQKAPATRDICKTLCMSEGYFRALYKKCFGVSYVQDCISARILLAQYLLLTTVMSIYAIALKCGYANEKYFDRQFRQGVGCSPMQYRAS